MTMVVNDNDNGRQLQWRQWQLQWLTMTVTSMTMTVTSMTITMVDNDSEVNDNDNGWHWQWRQWQWETRKESFFLSLFCIPPLEPDSQPKFHMSKKNYILNGLPRIQQCHSSPSLSVYGLEFEWYVPSHSHLQRSWWEILQWKVTVYTDCLP